MKSRLVFFVGLMFLLVACKPDYRVNKEWQMPKVGQKYVHCKNETMVESNTEFIKYRIKLKKKWIGREAWRNKAAFVTVKNDMVVSIWMGPQGW